MHEFGVDICDQTSGSIDNRISSHIYYGTLKPTQCNLSHEILSNCKQVKEMMLWNMIAVAGSWQVSPGGGGRWVLYQWHKRQGQVETTSSIYSRNGWALYTSQPCPRGRDPSSWPLQSWRGGFPWIHVIPHLTRLLLPRPSDRLRQDGWTYPTLMSV